MSNLKILAYISSFVAFLYAFDFIISPWLGNEFAVLLAFILIFVGISVFIIAFSMRSIFSGQLQSDHSQKGDYLIFSILSYFIGYAATMFWLFSIVGIFNFFDPSPCVENHAGIGIVYECDTIWWNIHGFFASMFGTFIFLFFISPIASLLALLVSLMSVFYFYKNGLQRINIFKVTNYLHILNIVVLVTISIDLLIRFLI